MAVMPPEHIFRAYDIRGRVDGGLDAAAVGLIGRALGSEARARGQRRLALGRDGRLSSPALGAALASGVRAAGVEVLDIGQVPTPVLYYAALTRTDGNGAMLTGSHNPPEYNGIKAMLGGEALSGDAVQGLYRRIGEGALAAGAGRYVAEDVTGAYLDRIAGEVRLARPLKVVVDGGNGVAGPLAPTLLRRLGCEVQCLYCEVDGRFPNHHPDPSRPENLHDLKRAVAAAGADLGLAFDGDGDRLGVVSAEGAAVWPDRLLVLFARDILARHPGALVVYDVKCSTHLERAVNAAGGRAEMWRTGHSPLKARMRERGALLAGEMSGHLFFADRWYGFDDGLYAAARLLELLSRDGRPPSAQLAELPDAPNTPELQVAMAEGEPFRFMAALGARPEAFAGARLTRIDGLRADYADGWGLVRASNTTPALVLRFEGESPAALARVQAVFRGAMQAVDPDLRLPF